MSVHGAMGYAPRLSAPRCPIFVLAPNILGRIPSANAKILVLSTHLPNTGEGWPKATRHENTCLLGGQSVDHHCRCPPKTLKKFHETGGTVTHSLQVLHSLQWHQPLKAERTQPCSSPHPGIPHLHSHATWWRSGPLGPVRMQENTALLSCCGLTSTSQHVTLLGRGGKERSVCVHTV